MKNPASLLPFLFLMVISGSCKKNDLFTFYVEDQETIRIETPVAFPVNTVLPIPLVPVTTNSQEELSQNNTRADLVKNVSLDRLSLTITDPPGKTFIFLKKIEIFISTTNDNEVRLAYLDEVPVNAGSTISLNSTGAKLDRFLKAPQYTIRTSATIREPVTQDITIRADMRFKVTADPL